VARASQAGRAALLLHGWWRLVGSVLTLALTRASGPD
jgi:hypothetical protein